MKKIHHILLFLMGSALVLTGCDSLLNVDSDRYAYEEDFRMNSAHDTIYSMVGVLSQLQKLGDRYVLLGELRSELMQTTDDASKYLKEINDFDLSKENPYIQQKDYYAVINSCNYITHYVDTSYTKLSDKENLRVYAAAKSIRAWTYLQMALNYDTVRYYTNPIFDVKDATRDYPRLTLPQLTDSLISDLLPYRSINTLDLGQFGAFDSKKSIFPIRFVLGDLYLWKGDYENAARMYHELMLAKSLSVTNNYSSTWTVSTDGKGVFLSFTQNWNKILLPSSPEIISTLASSPDYGNPFTLDSLSFHNDIAPTNVALKKWNEAIYYHDVTAQNEGDLRAYGSYYHAEDLTSTLPASKYPYIVKYQYMNTSSEKCLVIYRNSLLYLRYAEAVNRLNCPQLALAVLKNGLNANTTNILKPVNAEITRYGNGSVPSFMRFSDAAFTTNVGIRARGLGNLNMDTIQYIIPKKNTLADSVKYVEDLIIEETALETAFEGNRFHDLMRIALRRNDPAYLADKVSAKYGADKAAMKAKLMDKAYWYLPR